MRLRAARTTKYYDYSRLSFEDFAVMAAWGEKATLSVPLIYGDEVFGVLDVAESRYPRRFTADEVRLAEAIGAQAAVAIHNARAFDEAERRNADLATLLGVAATLSRGRPRHRARRPSPGTCARPWARRAPRSTSYDAARRTLELVARDAADAPARPTSWPVSTACATTPCSPACIDERRVMAVQADAPTRVAAA